MGTPRWRIDLLIAGETLPAWDEVQLLAWHFKVPLSVLIQPLQRARTSPLAPCAAIRAWTTPRGNANRVWSLQALAALHPKIFDVTLADWPAWLAPNLAECLATEVAVLSIDGLPAIDNLQDVLDVARGVESRLRALTVRHGLRLTAPHRLGAHSMALGFDQALCALHRLIDLLQSNTTAIAPAAEPLER